MAKSTRKARKSINVPQPVALLKVRGDNTHALLTSKRLVIGYGTEEICRLAAKEDDIVQQLKVYQPKVKKAFVPAANIQRTYCVLDRTRKVILQGTLGVCSEFARTKSMEEGVCYTVRPY